MRPARYSLLFFLLIASNNSSTNVSSFSLTYVNTRQRKPSACTRLFSTDYLRSLTLSKEECGQDVTSIDTRSDILASLLGNAEVRDSFFANDFGKNTVIRRRDYTNGDLPPPLSGIDMSSLYETNGFIALRVRGSRDMLDKSTMSYDDFTEYIENGSSAIVPIIDTDYMNDFKQDMEDVLGQSVSMNVYHSGPGAVALNKHYDSYDVFVLQLAGEKEWIIQADGEREKLSSITTWTNTKMIPGDIMYLPRGIFHAATGGQKGSTHVTIGLEKL